MVALLVLVRNAVPCIPVVHGHLAPSTELALWRDPPDPAGDEIGSPPLSQRRANSEFLRCIRASGSFRASPKRRWMLRILCFHAEPAAQSTATLGRVRRSNHDAPAGRAPP